MRLPPQPPDGQVDFQMQLLKVHTAKIPQLHLFEVVPEALVQRAEVGSVPRHCLYLYSLRCFASQEFAHLAPAMDRRAIPDYEQPLSRLHQQVLQEKHAVRTGQRFLANQRVDLSGQRQTRHDRKMVAAQPLVDDRRLPFRSIGSHNARQQVNARFIGKNQSPALPRRSPTQFGPHFHSPACDSLLVALNRAGDRNLWRPTQLLQQTRHVVFVVTDSEFPFDNLGNTNAGPDVAAKTIRLCAVPKKIRDQTFLCERELGRMSRRCMRSQSLPAGVLSLMNPLADSRRGNVQGVGDVMLSPTTPLQVPGSETAPLFPVMWGGDRRSHTPILRERSLSSLRSDQ